MPFFLFFLFFGTFINVLLHFIFFYISPLDSLDTYFNSAKSWELRTGMTAQFIFCPTSCQPYNHSVTCPLFPLLSSRVVGTRTSPTRSPGGPHTVGYHSHVATSSFLSPVGPGSGCEVRLGWHLPKGEMLLCLPNSVLAEISLPFQQSAQMLLQHPGKTRVSLRLWQQL